MTARTASDQQQQQQQHPPRPTAAGRRTTAGERATPDLDPADGIDGGAPVAASAERDALAAAIRAQDAANAPDARSTVRNGLKYTLVIRQQPVHARLCGTAGSLDRRPIDPPPVVQVRVESVDQAQNAHFPNDWYTHNPRLFVYAAAVPMPREKVRKDRDGGDSDEAEPAPTAVGGKAAPTLTYGSIVSALFRMPDVDGTNAAFAVFPDISVKNEGKLRFRFVLCEMVGAKVRRLASILSRPVTVWTPKKFPGLTPSTAWTRYVVHHGVKLRIRCMPTARTAAAAPESRTAAGSTTPPSGTTPAPPPAPTGRRRGKRARDATTHDADSPAHPPPRPRPRALTLATTTTRAIDPDAILPLSPPEYDYHHHAPNPPIAVPSQPHHVDPGAGLAAGYPGAYVYEVPSQPATPLLADAGGWGIDTMPPHAAAGWDHGGRTHAGAESSMGWAHWGAPAAHEPAGRYASTTTAGWAHARGSSAAAAGWGDTIPAPPPIPIPPPTPTHAVYSTSVPPTPMAAAFHVPATPTTTAFGTGAAAAGSGYHHHHPRLPPPQPTAAAADAYLPPTPTGVPMHFLTGPTADGAASAAPAPTVQHQSAPYYHQHYQTAVSTAAAAAAAWAHADVYYTRAAPAAPVQQPPPLQAGQMGHHHYLADPTAGDYAGMGGYPRHAARVQVPVPAATAGAAAGNAWHGGDGRPVADTGGDGMRPRGIPVAGTGHERTNYSGNV
ncbi:hypothetical protein GGF32_002563 [Allomyces javanicus]|nr:hypothetical protein GGF32_002563 [Allomyces javanicus]